MTAAPSIFSTHGRVGLLAAALCLARAGAATYHVDSAHGQDNQSGTSPGQAWRSLEKANAVTLRPGDQLLFRAGGRWSGQLKPLGGGNAGALVTIGRYGDGPRPRIDGGGKFRDTVLLRNMAFVELADLEVTNLGPATAPWRTGVYVSADGSGPLERIYLRRLHVHDVNGDLRKDHEGCGIFFEAKGGKDTRFDGLLIENCRVERTDRNGICQRGLGKSRSTRVIIRGNHLEDIGGDGIKLWGTNGGLIEHNVVRKARARCAKNEAAAGIWPFACDDTIIQFNEVSGTIGTTDGQAFDSDYQCRRTLIQYNYSFQNEGGFLLVCAPGGAVNDGTIVRYNISIHDGLDSARVFHFGGASTNTHVYNNTIVIGPHQDIPLLLFTEWNGGHAKHTTFSNNLFLVEEGGRATFQLTPGTGHRFESNLFAGRHDGLPPAATLSPAPAFAGRIQPAPGLASPTALRPAPGTRFPRGTVIQDNGGRDFFGNAVPARQAPAIGAVEK